MVATQKSADKKKSDRKTSIQKIQDNSASPAAVKKKRSKKNKPLKNASSSYTHYMNTLKPGYDKLSDQEKAALKAEGNPWIVYRKKYDQWSTMSDEQKVPFQQQSVADKERYQRELKALSDEDFLVQTGKKRKKPRAKSGYILYCEMHRPKVRAENPEKKMIELSTILGQGWRSLSKEEQQVYNQNAKDQFAKEQASKQ